MNDELSTPLRFRHVIHNTAWPRTYAYRRRRGSQWVEVSVAYCSPKDQFNRHTGRVLAECRFALGHYIIMPWEHFRILAAFKSPSKETASLWIDSASSAFTYPESEVIYSSPKKPLQTLKFSVP